MQRTITILAVLLAAQLLLAAGISITEPELSASRPDAELVELDVEAVDGVEIEGPDGAEVVLAREDGGWVLPRDGAFPAREAGVDELLESLSGLQRGFAVATSAAARSRLRVADDEFERRLTFLDGETELETLYVGSSAGARQSHARTARDEGVYLVDFGAFDAPADSGDWQDKTTLQIPRDEIHSIVLGDLTLSRVAPDAAEPGDGADAAASSGEAPDTAAADDAAPSTTAPSGEAPATEPAPTWTLAGGAADALVDQANADALALELARLRTGPVLGSEALDEYGLDEPALEIGVIKTDGERVDFTLGSREDAESYVLKSSARPEYFELTSARADQLVNAASREQLVQTPGAASEDGSADAEAETPDDEASAAPGNDAPAPPPAGPQ